MHIAVITRCIDLNTEYNLRISDCPILGVNIGNSMTQIKIPRLIQADY